MSSLAAKLTLLLLPFALAGCSRPQPTVDQVAGPTTPADLHFGPTPPGGASEAPTGAGAGGSAAAGYEAGRVGSTLERPTLPEQKVGITYSRMSPVGSSGSGLGDRGNPIPPDASLAAAPDPVPAAVRAAAQPAALAKPAAAKPSVSKPGTFVPPSAVRPPAVKPH